MVDSIPVRWTSAFNGRLAKRRNGLQKARKQRETLRELRKAWVRLAFYVVGSTEGLEPVVLGITSAVHGEGKTTNCLGLGSTLAKETGTKETGTKVMILECDLGNPGLASALEMEPRPGLVEYLKGGAEIGEVVRQTRLADLDVVVAGGQEDGDTDWEKLSEPPLRELRRDLPDILAQMRQRYRYILLDMPPVLENAYAKEMVSSTNGTFLTVRVGATPLESMKRVAQELNDETLLGVILAGAASPLPDWVAHLLSE